MKPQLREFRTASGGYPLRGFVQGVMRPDGSLRDARERGPGHARAHRTFIFTFFASIRIRGHNKNKDKGSSLLLTNLTNCNLDTPGMAIESLIRSSASANRTTQGMIHRRQVLPQGLEIVRKQSTKDSTLSLPPEITQADTVGVVTTFLLIRSRTRFGSDPRGY